MRGPRGDADDPGFSGTRPTPFTAPNRPSPSSSRESSSAQSSALSHPEPISSPVQYDVSVQPSQSSASSASDDRKSAPRTP
ncbi:hypothetical protein HGRIS_009977 [Hohenbuehelia grisea]|uniref:Uncharacterized protein n=1 Tax=Hohenbuehelia grisea TaxID=104357 RepID=A0ABR3J2U7_9AGAR